MTEGGLVCPECGRKMVQTNWGTWECRGHGEWMPEVAEEAGGVREDEPGVRAVTDREILACWHEQIHPPGFEPGGSKQGRRRRKPILVCKPWQTLQC